MSVKDRGIRIFRMDHFKAKGKDQDALRKNKRDEIIEKRRNVPPEYEWLDTHEEETALLALVKQAKIPDQGAQAAAMTALRELTNPDERPPNDPLIDAGLLPILVTCLSPKASPTLQVEGAWTLGNMAIGTIEQTAAVMDSGAIPHLITLLSSPHQNVCERAVMALGNIMGDGPESRDYVVAMGVVTPLLNLIKPDIPINLLQKLTWTMVQLCLHCPEDQVLPAKALRQIVPAISPLVPHPHTLVLKNTVEALNSITRTSPESIQLVIDAGLLPKLVALFGHPEVKVQAEAVMGVANIIVTGTDEQIRAVLDCDPLSHFHSLLSHCKEKICKLALWFLNHLTIRDLGDQVDAVFAAELCPLIISQLDLGEFETQKFAVVVLSKLIMDGTRGQLSYLVNCGVIPPLCNLLSSNDSRVVKHVLQGIHNILIASNGVECERVTRQIEDCGGLDEIENLQNHENPDIFRIAIALEDYFYEDESPTFELSSAAAPAPAPTPEPAAAAAPEEKLKPKVAEFDKTASLLAPKRKENEAGSDAVESENETKTKSLTENKTEGNDSFVGTPLTSGCGRLSASASLGFKMPNFRQSMGLRYTKPPLNSSEKGRRGRTTSDFNTPKK